MYQIHPLIVMGSGRSGTTWVVDALAEANQLRTIFEPLHPSVSKIGSRYAYRYIKSGADEPELHSFVRSLVSGEFRSIWSDYRVRTDRLYPTLGRLASREKLKLLVARWRKLIRQRNKYRKEQGRQPIIKFIRANLMAGWIRSEFNARIVVIVRHPGSVIASKMHLGGEDWDPVRMLDRYSLDAALVEGVFGKMSFQLPEKMSAIQMHAVLWCIENTPVLRNENQWGIRVVFYENLLSSEAEWEGMVEWLGLQNVPSVDKLRIPSQQVAPDKVSGSIGKAQLNDWMVKLSEEELNEIQDILDLFDTREYRVEYAMPQRN